MGMAAMLFVEVTFLSIVSPFAPVSGSVGCRLYLCGSVCGYVLCYSDIFARTVDTNDSRFYSKL
jgi:hypothetical protein